MRVLFTTVLLHLFVWPLVAGAQDDVPSTEPEGSAPAVFEGDDKIRSFRKGFSWFSVGPKDAGRITDISISPSDPQRVAAIAADGRVWLTIDGGDRWRLALPAVRRAQKEASRDEDLLLEAEARSLELLEEVTDLSGEDPDLEDFDEDEAAEYLGSEAAASGLGAGDEVEAELASNPWFLKLMAAGSRPVRPRVWLDERDHVVVGRPDGTFVSKDLGRRWQRVLDRPVTALLRLPRSEVWVAGTEDGIRLAVNPTAWIDPEDGTEGVRIFELTLGDEGVYAASESGLWYASDGEYYERIGKSRKPIVEVAVVPGPRRGPWVSYPDGLHQLMPDGSKARRLPRVELLGVTSVVAVTANHLLAAGGDGVFESVDGGYTWLRLSRGLNELSSTTVATAGGVVWLGNARGLYRLEDSPEALAEAGSLEEVIGSFVSRESLIEAALQRPGLAPPNYRGQRLKAYFLPRLLIESRFNPDRDLRFRDYAGTGREADGNFMVVARLTWSPQPRRNLDAVDLMVIADQVAVADTGGDQSILMARLDRVYSQRSNKVADSVSDLFVERVELVRDRERLRADDLLRKTLHEIDIREIEAQLDLLTDGTVSRWKTGQIAGENQ